MSVVGPTHTHTHTHLRAWGQSWESCSTEESDPACVERRASAQLVDDHHSFRVAMQRPPDQETVANLLGDMAQDLT